MFFHILFFRVTSDQYKYAGGESSGDVKETVEEVEERQILDFSPPSSFPLLRGEDSGFLTRRAEYGSGRIGTQKRWQTFFSHGTNNLESTETEAWSPDDPETSIAHLEFGAPEEEEGTWVLVHDDYWDRRDRLRRNVDPSEEKSSLEATERLHRSANPESWTVWHGGPREGGSGKFATSQLGPWEATQVPTPDLGAWPPTQGNWEEDRLPTSHPVATVQRNPEAPRPVRNPPPLPRKPRRPPRPGVLSFLNTLNPFAPKRRAQNKQSNAFQVLAQNTIRDNFDSMMSLVGNYDERNAWFRQLMRPRR